jgi:hypothetical protein
MEAGIELNNEKGEESDPNADNSAKRVLLLYKVRCDSISEVLGRIRRGGGCSHFSYLQLMCGFCLPNLANLEGDGVPSDKHLSAPDASALARMPAKGC